MWNEPNAECGMRNAEWQREFRFAIRPSLYTPHSAFHIPHYCALRPRPTLTNTPVATRATRSEEHTSELQSHHDLVCRLLLEKKKKKNKTQYIQHTTQHNT